jgi:hypothetical protein
MDSHDFEKLAAFLIEAKLHTYASQSDEASVKPLLDGARQLEYRQGEFFYRDCYFGGRYFAGQETVYWQGQPIWSMVYAGGLLDGIDEEVLDPSMIYAFLQAALRKVQPGRPMRGPERWQDCAWMYEDRGEGDMSRFYGREKIFFQGDAVYALDYCGGALG